MSRASVVSDEQRVLDAINESRYIWRPAEAISKETGLPLRRVRDILKKTRAAQVLQAARKNRQGFVLYTTAEHLMHSSGLIKRYLRTLESS
jgi:hypothetical protein